MRLLPDEPVPEDGGAARPAAVEMKFDSMKVYKFGGASVRNADGVRNLHKIIAGEENLFIVVSAMGKTTNALEQVFTGLQRGDRALSEEQIAALRDYHAGIIEDLWHGPKRLERVDELFAELERVATQTVYRAEDAELWYDAIVAYGELLSTTIVSEYLNAAGVANHWVDMRRCFRTEMRHKDAAIDIAASAPLLRAELAGRPERVFIGQGFIGGAPTERPPRSAAKVRTTRRPWRPTSSTPSRCRCGRMSTAC